MTSTLTHTEVTRLPQMDTSRLRELQYAVEYQSREYALAGSRKAEAWRMYDEAIDDMKPREEIHELGKVAEIFETQAVTACLLWQAAKRELLAFWN